MATAKKTAVVKAAPVAKKITKTYSYTTVDKNNYTQKVSDLVSNGATIVTITVNQDVRNSYDVHYFTVA
jgi:hypothetical protein